jgi:hypothetical protein
MNWEKIVKNISPYLIDGNNGIVVKKSKPLSDIPPINFGSMPNDDGNLILTLEEKNLLVSAHSSAQKFVKSFIGSQEFIKGIQRFCLWIDSKDLKEAKKIPEIQKRIEKNQKYRLESTRAETRALAAQPYAFGEIRYKNANAIIVPRVSSELRPYLTIGIVNKDTVISDAAFAIYGAPTYLFAILSSRLHLIWASAIGGQLESRLRYSATLIYNTFPVPDLSIAQKLELEEFAVRILVIRESYLGKTIADLYDAQNMPRDLRSCHKELDEKLESIYSGKPFKSDSERLQFLFEQYFLALEKEPAGNNNESQQLSMFTIGD